MQKVVWDVVWLKHQREVRTRGAQIPWALCGAWTLPSRRLACSLKSERSVSLQGTVALSLLGWCDLLGGYSASLLLCHL